MPIGRTWKTGALLVAPCLLIFAEGPSWRNKPIGQWDSEDAKQVLTDSPWAKSVTPQWVRDLSPDQRRDSGDLGADQGKGVGLNGLIGIFDPAGAAEAIARAHAKPDPGAFLIRWESARPVRAAEQRLRDPAPPALESDDFYTITIYNVPTPKRWHIEGELKGIAFLKRAGKKDLRPWRVVILRKAGDLATVVYLFRRSEITKKDGSVTFQAQIERLVFTRIFNTYEMQIDDQLEL